MTSVHLSPGLSREQALTHALPVVVDMLEHGDGPYVDEGVLADLIALHWLRCEGGSWSMTAAGARVMQSLSRRGELRPEAGGAFAPSSSTLHPPVITAA